MKKRLLFITFLVLITTIYSQNKKGKPFFTGTLNTTFAINENYTLDPDDDESLIIPSAILLRIGAGYQFNRRISTSIHIGFDSHSTYDVAAFPTYMSLRYNITEDAGDTFFIETSYGKMWRPAERFEDGKYYGIGVGAQITGSKRWNTIFRLDFHRKSILNFENNGHLDSVSLGIGFSFF